MKLLLPIIMLLFFSCKYEYFTEISIAGKFKMIDKYKQHYKNPNTQKDIDTETIIDTVNNNVILKSHCKTVNNGAHNYNRETTIKYNKKHQKIEKYVCRNQKGTTIKYYKNYDGTEHILDTLKFKPIK